MSLLLVGLLACNTNALPEVGDTPVDFFRILTAGAVMMWEAALN